MTNTQANIGIRRSFATLGDRNFENDGITQYQCGREGLAFGGQRYHVGDTLPFDVTNSSPNYYSSATLVELENYWNQGWLTPIT